MRRQALPALGQHARGGLTTGPQQGHHVPGDSNAGDVLQQQLGRAVGVPPHAHRHLVPGHGGDGRSPPDLGHQVRAELLLIGLGALALELACGCMGSALNSSWSCPYWTRLWDAAVGSPHPHATPGRLIRRVVCGCRLAKPRIAPGSLSAVTGACVCCVLARTSEGSFIGPRDFCRLYTRTDRAATRLTQSTGRRRVIHIVQYQRQNSWRCQHDKFHGRT